MTCHVARRVGEFAQRLRRDRHLASEALATTDAELAEYTYEHPGDVVDDAATNSAYRLLATLEARDRRVLEEIDAAEARLYAGRFGACETCGRRIPVERLRALPAARRCIACEETAEQSRTRRTPSMTAWKLVTVMAALGLLIGVGPAWAQSPPDAHHPPAAAPAAAAPDASGPGAMPMMDMCRQMMSGPMMGMGAGADGKMDPKMTAHMLEMRGEMMKAMGEVMMKHGKMMQGPSAK